MAYNPNNPNNPNMPGNRSTAPMPGDKYPPGYVAPVGQAAGKLGWYGPPVAAAPPAPARPRRKAQPTQAPQAPPPSPAPAYPPPQGPYGAYVPPQLQPAPYAPYGPPAWPASPIAPDPIATPAEPERCWPAALTLYLLAPLVGEMLSGSTPPLQFVNPGSLIFLTAFYGSSALLARDIVRRHSLGWGSLLLLGAAFGILNEGLVVTSWTNPFWPDVLSLGGYGRALDINWFWALGLTTYHAVVSISIPIVLTEAIFPRVADRPWLGKKTFRFLVAWLALISVVAFALFGIVMFQKQGYRPPLLPYLFILALGAVSVWLATHPPRHALHLLRRTASGQNPPTNPPAFTVRAAPALGRLRIYGFVATLAFFIVLWGTPALIKFAPLAAALMVALITFAATRLRRWSRMLGWSARHRLALASGVVFLFILYAPFVEFVVHPAGKVVAGMTLVAVGWLVFLIVLARFARRAEAKRLGLAPATQP
ncbi:MAG: hypothetical protein ABI068_07920 [Ktedonobacterales bacterium]